MDTDPLRLSELRIKHEPKQKEIDKLNKKIKKLENSEISLRKQILMNCAEVLIFDAKYSFDLKTPDFNEYLKHTEIINESVEDLPRHPFYKYLSYWQGQNGNILLVYNNGPRKGQKYFEYSKDDFDEKVSRKQIQNNLKKITPLVARISKETETYGVEKILGGDYGYGKHFEYYTSSILEKIVGYLYDIVYSSSAESFLLFCEDKSSPEYKNISLLLSPEQDKIRPIPTAFLTKIFTENSSLEKNQIEKFITILSSNWGRYQTIFGFDPLGIDYANEVDLVNPEVIIHRTNSNALPNIIQLGGLTSSDLLKSLDIPKDGSGENFAKIDGYTGCAVSFCLESRLDENEYNIAGGWGHTVFPSYPMSFVIGKNNMRRLSLKKGSMPGINEVIAYDFVPLEYIDKICVPRFKVAEVKAILKVNDYSYIDVLANSR